MSEGNADNQTEGQPFPARPFRPIELSENFFTTVYDYNSSATLTAIANQHADNLAAVGFADVRELVTDELAHFRELLDSSVYLTPGQRSDRIVEHNMLERANAWFENNPEAAVVDISAVYDADSTQHEYQIGRNAGSLYYTFEREKLDNYYDAAYAVEDREALLESMIESLNTLQQGNPIPQEGANQIEGFIYRKRNLWVRQVKNLQKSDEAKRNVHILNSMGDCVQARTTKSA